MGFLSTFDLLLLAAFGSLMLLGVAAALTLLRTAMDRVEDAATICEILRAHPDLLLQQPWRAWSDSVNLKTRVAEQGQAAAGRLLS